MGVCLDSIFMQLLPLSRWLHLRVSRQERGPQLCEKLCGCLLGGRGDRSGVYYILRDGFRTACSRQQCICGYSGLSYVAELCLTSSILVGAVKASDRVVREMMGL